MYAESNNARRRLPGHDGRAMAISTKTYTIEPVDLSTAYDDLAREAAALHNAMASERVPEDPPFSFEAFASRVRNRPSMVVIRAWLARSAEGELVGRGFVVRFEADTNQHLREAGIDVLSAHRRTGIAKQLFREIGSGARGGASAGSDSRPMRRRAGRPDIPSWPTTR